MNLHELSPAPGSRTKHVRVGRGLGSGLGKTSPTDRAEKATYNIYCLLFHFSNCRVIHPDFPGVIHPEI